VVGGDTGSEVDLAVVGGGVAGAYVAYRVARSRPDWSIALFERGERIGGRLVSLFLPGVARPAELGGMRFRLSQPLVTGVVNELGLDTRPFSTVHDDNRFFLRGGRWRHCDPADASTFYQLGENERGVPPAELLVAALDRVVPGASALSDDEWREVKREYTYNGRPLRNWNLAEVLATVLTEEGYRYVLDGFGYETLLGERNAADAIPWVLIEARPEAENTTLVDGMEQLPRQLAAQFVRCGGTMNFGHELSSVEQDGGALRLHFEKRGSVNARRVVLAMPRRALEAVAERSPLLATPQTASALGSVTGHAAAKLAFAYECPWWRDNATAALRAVSDLPLSKTYYFDERTPAALYEPALLLASYCDGSSREFWRGLARQGGFPADPGPMDAAERWQRYAASPAQIDAGQRLLAELHAAPHVPQPTGSAFVDWGAEPFGAAWHVWNPGVSSAEMMSRILRPLPSIDLYVCGEAYSSSQGWIEGALETAQAVVDQLG
jgi:monoamine oxidase